MEYWRSTKLELEYLNMTTAWKIGGSNVTFDGKGVGTLDGNGQLWLVEFANPRLGFRC